MRITQRTGWQFTDNQGTFELLNPHKTSYLYFPLVNHAGMFSCVSPMLNGDAKTGQHEFLLMPVSVEDLLNTCSARNFWVRVNDQPWSVTGNSSAQVHQDETVKMTAGFLWHLIEREHAASGLKASVLNFVPENADTLELMQVTLFNGGAEPVDLVPTAAIPIYGRSADNLRDHRHVTALLHRTICHPNGVLVRPEMSFDERGHKKNAITYAVFGFDGDGKPPMGITPLLKDFLGEGGRLDWPEAVVSDGEGQKQVHENTAGFEAIGGLHFPPVRLVPGETKTYHLILGILPDDCEVDVLVSRYSTQAQVDGALGVSKAYWAEKLSPLQFDHQDSRYDGWLRWVTLQPELRKLMGNSFLPYHDYGKGGRGWRDLWQDMLAPLLTDASSLGQNLVDYFAGVRMDGSHATIIGFQPGEFFADRNSIPRVWMDHGAWPLFTIKVYLDMTGDLDLLTRQQVYFQDHLTHRCQKNDQAWQPDASTLLRTVHGEIAVGTILEHLLVENLTAFFNVGEHNLIRLEGGDWNDGMDMAAERGESVAFSALYAGNLRILSKLCSLLSVSGAESIVIAKELLVLLDIKPQQVDYHSIENKQARLNHYVDSVAGAISGEKEPIALSELSTDLAGKANWLWDQIREKEWITAENGLGWFNGYYDNLGHRVEGESLEGVWMTLTGQVFPLMTGIASYDQAQQIVSAAKCFLLAEDIDAYRLNTDFKENVPALGRAFSFAYGHKENGSVFSHMNVMFAYALYRQGLANEAWQILEGLYTQSQDFDRSRIYPGLPEYFDPNGRGMYPYLTGSAAWYLFTLLTESYGIKGEMGDLVLAPKLVADQFVSTNQLKVRTQFAGKKLLVTYINPQQLSYGEYFLGEVMINGKRLTLSAVATCLRITKSELMKWPDDVQIHVELHQLA